MPSLVRVIAVLLLPAVLGACATVAAGVVRQATGTPFMEKVVRSKVAPTVVVASDGTSCPTTDERWAEAEVGQPFLCAWSSDLADDRGAQVPQVSLP